jgi:hypothetical protein
MAWTHYAAASAVLLHALVYLGIGSQLPAPVSGWSGRSWLLRDAISPAHTARLSVMLHVTAGIAMLGSAGAIALAPQAPEYWRPVSIVAGGIGIVAFLVFYDGQPARLVDEGGLGALLSVVLVLTAVLWRN